MDFDIYGSCIINGRATNMDCIFYKKRKVSGVGLTLAVVCDGVGSLAQGAMAAQDSVAQLQQWFDQIQQLEGLGFALRNAIMQINTTILQHCQSQNIQSASTLSALLLVGDTYYSINLGDSRIYGAEPALVCMTQDDADEFGRLTQYMGKAEGILPKYAQGTITQKGFLLCSDGLYKKQTLDGLTLKCLGKGKFSFKKEVNALVQSAIAKGEKDNISAIIIGVRK